MNTLNDLHYKFFTPIRVRFFDGDPQGHVFYASYFIYCDEALLAYCREFGYDFKTLENLGLGYYYVDARCQFKGQAYVEDILHVHVYFSKLGKSSLTADFAIFRKETDELVAVAQTVGVIVDNETGKSTPIPDGLRDAIIKYQNG